MSPFVFERKDVHHALLKRLHGFASGYRQNVALLSQPQMGKTRLIKHLMQDPTVQASDLIPIYLEVPEVATVAEWSHLFVQAVLYGVVQTQPQASLPADFSELLCQLEAELPRSVTHVHSILEGAEEMPVQQLYGALWDLVALVGEEVQAPVVLVLESFERLGALDLDDPFVRLGQKIMIQSETLYILTSSKRMLARKILREGLDLLFGQFEEIELNALSVASSLKAIRGHVRFARNSFAEYVLMEFSHGIPANLNILLSDWPVDSGVTDEHFIATLTQRLETLFLDEASDVRRSFERRLESLPPDKNRLFCLQVLQSIAASEHRLKDLVKHLGRKKQTLLAALNVLEEQNLIVRDGTFYRIPDVLFRLWLKTAYPLLTGVYRVDAGQGRMRFQEIFGDWLREMQAVFAQPMDDRLESFLLSWRTERVVVEGRPMFLPEWKTIGRDRREGLPLALVGQKSARIGKHALFFVWDGALTEAQALEFVMRLKQQADWKSHNKFLLGAMPVEMDARVILQQARIKLLDLDVVNHLLHLYGFECLPVAVAEEVPAFDGTVALSLHSPEKPVSQPEQNISQQ